MTSSVTPADLGVGLRISVHPHCDDFERVILGALDDVTASGAAEGLLIETDDVSTYVGSDAADASQRLLDYAHTLIAATSRRADRRHVVAHLLLSRGCPGEATCDLTVRDLPGEGPVRLAATGLRAVAAWSLYPLDDSGRSHMDAIMGAIEEARSTGLEVSTAHYATRLAGDLAHVLACIGSAWTAVGDEVPHVVSHATISLDSPSAAPSPAPAAEAGTR